MDPPDERLRDWGLLEILSAESAESDESDECDDQIEVDDGSAESNDTVAETPPPTLTIGAVLDSLPKAKNGKTRIKFMVHSIYLRNWTVFYFNICNDKPVGTSVQEESSSVQGAILGVVDSWQELCQEC
jgi:hypothetical protein